MKKDASVAACGIITFGKHAAELFDALKPEAQDAAFLDLAEAIADRLNTTLHGLVVHMDETTIHAHYQVAGYNRDGMPLSQATSPAVMSGLQDLTAEVMARHCPGIERGNRYGDRIEAGADFRETLHRTVRELHRDLPQELEAKQTEIAALEAARREAQGRVDEMQDRVAKLTAKAELSDKEAKRLATYEKRLADRVAELEAAAQAAEAATAEEQRLAGIARAEAEEAEKRAGQADDDARRVSEKAGALLTATAALTAEMTAGTIRRSETGGIRVSDPAPIRGGLPELKPFLNVAADAAEARRQEDQAAEAAKAQRVRAEAEADGVRAEAARVLQQAEADRAAAAAARQETEAAKTEILTLRDRMRGVMSLLKKGLARVGQHLPKGYRAEADDAIRQAERLITPPASRPKPEKPGDDAAAGLGM